MPIVKLSGPPLEDRIKARYANSGVGRGTMPDKTTKVGDSPNRLFHNAHHSGGGQSAPPNNRGRDSDEGWRK